MGQTERENVIVSHFAWGALFAFVLAMLFVDIFTNRGKEEITLKTAGIWSTIWILCGIAVGGVIWAHWGSEYGLQYFSGYVIEKSLAVDNVFVWALLFAAFSIPRKMQRTILLYGVIGALVMRALLILGGSYLIKEFDWILYIFGVFLIYTGVKMFLQRDEHFDIESSRFYKFLTKRFKITTQFDGEKFFTKVDGVKYMTPLFLVLLLVEFMDLVFAVDSIPAIFAVTEEPFIVFASNALAILGLRALYFLISDLITKFKYLNEGLSVILSWVGVKMIVSHAFFKIPTIVSLSVIIVIIAISVIASVRSNNAQEH